MVKLLVYLLHQLLTNLCCYYPTLYPWIQQLSLYLNIIKIDLSPNWYHLLIDSSSLRVQFHWLVLIKNLELNIYWNNLEKTYLLVAGLVPTETPRNCRLIRYLILIDYLIKSSWLCVTTCSNFDLFRSSFQTKDLSTCQISQSTN